MRLHFLYVWIRSDEFELSNSIRLLRRKYPYAAVCLVGDKPKSVVLDHYFPFIQTGAVKAKRTSSAIIHGAKALKLLDCKEFVLMSDDEFICGELDFIPMHRGNLATQTYNATYLQAQKNTKEWLERFDLPAINYECHQPALMNIDDLLCIMACVDISYPHLLKTIYFNTFAKANKAGENLKVNSSAKAKQIIERHKCFSTNGVLSVELRKFIEAL